MVSVNWCSYVQIISLSFKRQLITQSNFLVICTTSSFIRNTFGGDESVTIADRFGEIFSSFRDSKRLWKNLAVVTALVSTTIITNKALETKLLDNCLDIVYHPGTEKILLRDLAKTAVRRFDLQAFFITGQHQTREGDNITREEEINRHKDIKQSLVKRGGGEQGMIKVCRRISTSSKAT